MNELLSTEFRQSIEKSLDSLQKGIATFEQLNDVTNLSLVSSNLGRLTRLQAHIAYKELDDCMKLSICGELYSLATAYYQKALGLLESKRRNPALWEVITWELSTSSYTIAKLYFETKSDEGETREKTISYLQTALKNCVLDTNSARYEEFYQRTGDVHFMLGFSHEGLLAMPMDSEKKRKSLIHLTFFHYDKALSVYEASNRLYEFANVAVFELDFLQSLLTEPGSVNMKLKYLANVKALLEQFVRVLENRAKVDCVEDARVGPVLLKVEEKLKNFFMALIKCLNSGNSTVKSKETKLAPLKKMFAYLLRSNSHQMTSAVIGNELTVILMESFKKILLDLINSDLLN